ncbi:hypothetical protein [Streptomyces collinus]|uniref:hypothetical protein n=1 Tax=Streptomyces collinus TaxID=42684 RepID=UPI0036E42FD6
MPAAVPALSARPQPGEQGRTGRSGLVRRNAVLTACLRRPRPVALRAVGDLAPIAATGRPGARRALRATLERLPTALAQRHTPPRTSNTPPGC